MDVLTIAEIPGVDGEYPFDFDARGLSNGELHLIKQVSGIRAGEIEEAFAASDNDLMVALAAIILKRNDKDVPVSVLWDAPAGCLTFQLEDDAEADADGKPLPPPSALDASANADANESSSGKTSPERSESPESGHPDTGTQPLAIAATSGRAT